jgi:hypothetical protein
VNAIGQRVMAKLVDKLGGVERASTELGITASLLRLLAEGKVPVPDNLLLKAVSLLEETPELPSRTPPQDPATT